MYNLFSSYPIEAEDNSLQEERILLEWQDKQSSPLE